MEISGENTTKVMMYVSVIYVMAMIVAYGAGYASGKGECEEVCK